MESLRLLTTTVQSEVLRAPSTSSFLRLGLGVGLRGNYHAGSFLPWEAAATLLQSLHSIPRCGKGNGKGERKKYRKKDIVFSSMSAANDDSYS